MREIVVDRGITQSRIGLFENGKLEKIYVDDVVDSSISGNIYLGRVENVVNNMKAAFINIGLAKNALLHFEDAVSESNLVRGSSILVQVIREPAGDKGPRVSGRISIPGKYMVIHPGVRVHGVSKKIEDENVRKRLKSTAHSIAKEDIGVVLRTESVSAVQEELEKEYNSLSDIWKGIKKNAEYFRAPKLLFNSKDLLNYIFREIIKADINSVYFNNADDRDYLNSILSSQREMNHIQLLFDEFNFARFIKLQNSMEELRDSRVELPGGGFLVIDKTEAAVVIDVNSGSHKSGESFEETIFQVNHEAAKAIFKYVNLQNLSGIIIIDFINMDDESNKGLIIKELTELFKSDVVPARVSAFTEMGLVEISRARKGRRAVDFIFRNERENEFTASYALKNLENICVRELKQKRKNHFSFFISAYIKEYLDKYHNNFIKSMKELHGINIELIQINYIENFFRKTDGCSREIKVEYLNKIIYGVLNEMDEDNNGNIIINMKRI